MEIEKKERKISVAIDGPSGAGKSTLARAAAKELDFLYVDTGAIYRTAALYMLRRKAAPESAGETAALLPEIDISMTYSGGIQRMLLNGEDVTDRIRTQEVSMAASVVAAHPPVRAFLLEMQRNMAKEHSVIMDGRDIGTVVLPNADLKIFLTAAPEARARRRLLELEQRGEAADYEAILHDIRARDYQDEHRPIAPLKQAADAVLLDTTDLDLGQSMSCLLSLVKEKIGP